MSQRIRPFSVIVLKWGAGIFFQNGVDCSESNSLLRLAAHVGKAKVGIELVRIHIVQR